MGLADKTDPREGRAKMLALLALLDVLDGRAEMAAIGTEKLGPLDARAGQLRLRFTVFGNESRLLELAHELAAVGSMEELTAIVRSRISREDKLRMVARMISTWSEVMQRLLTEDERPALPSGAPALPRGGG